MRKVDAYRVHIVQTLLFSLAGSMVWTAMIVFRITALGLDPLQLVLTGTVMETTIFLFEVPTGIVADLYSRRLSTIIGYALIGVSYIAQGAIPLFEVTLGGQVVWGIGYTFTSGAYDAWLVDEVGQERAGQAFMRSAQAGRIAGLIGMVVSVVLGNIDLRLPIIGGGIVTILVGVLLALFMPEEGFKPTPSEDRNTWQKMVDTFREGVRVIRSRPLLLNILAVSVFLGLFSEGWDRLWQKHLLDTFGLETATHLAPITFFAVLSSVGMALSVVATELARRHVSTNHPQRLARVLFWLVVVMVVGIVSYGIAPHILVALGAYFAFTVARDLVGPLFSTWTNQHIDSQVRATVLSMQSQTDAIGQIIGGPPIGAVGELSLQAAFVLSGLILSPAAFLLRRVQRALPGTPDNPVIEAGLDSQPLT